MIIRTEQDQDAAGIVNVVGQAFNRETEVDLVRLIKERGEASISLVAVDNETVVGHVLVSPMVLAARGLYGGVAPLSVLPTRQGTGIGSSLMRRVEQCATEMGYDALFLLGDPDYYSRFGYQPSHIGNEYGATDAFQHLELRPGSLKGVEGTGYYVKAFADVGA